jgi:hypothetical protein
MFTSHSKRLYEMACEKCYRCCYNLNKYFTWLSSWYCAWELEIYKSQMTSRSRMVELYLRSPIHIHAMVLNYGQGKLYIFTLSSVMLITIMEASLLIIIFQSYRSAWCGTIPFTFTYKHNLLKKFQRPVLSRHVLVSHLNVWKLLTKWENDRLSKTKNVSDACYIN